MTSQNFIDHVISTLSLWGVEVELSPSSQVYTLPNNEGLACSGFFSEFPKPRLAVATGKSPDQWLAILAHEFSHACQWKEKSSLWGNLFDDWGYGQEEASDALDRWLEGEEWSEEKLEDIVARIRDIEMDCEKRVVDLIDRFSLPLKKTEYIQKANAYVFFYNQVKKTRKWYEKGQAPYEIEDVWKQAPCHFIEGNITPHALQASFDKYYPQVTLSRLAPKI